MDCTKRATNFAEHHDRAQDSQSPPPAQWEQGRWRTAQSTATAIRYADPVGMLRIPRAGTAGVVAAWSRGKGWITAEADCPIGRTTFRN